MHDSFTAPLTGRVLLVTGGSSGIGRAIAMAAARAGADVALTYRTNETGARAVEQEIARFGRRTSVIRLDLADLDSVRTTGRVARDTLGRIDAWINNAGADILTGPAASMPLLDRLDLLIRVDLRGTMVASWEAAGILASQPEGGVIINMAGPNPQLFAAVKGGVLAFSKALARTVAPRVRVNVIAPGWIETSFGAGVDQKTYQMVAESTPLKRWGTPEDVAGAAVYLASPAAAFLTGETIYVGGGIVT
jgi:3-oxoacyl-[acyl-carrier protein] reductase